MSSLAAIHTGKKALGLDDDTYREMLARVTGKHSAKELNEKERMQVVEEMRRQGFKPVSRGARKPLEGKYAKKLQALWIAGWNLGIVEDRNDKALLAFIKRQTGIDHVRFLRDGDDAYSVIEAMKKWLGREAGVNWGVAGLPKESVEREPAYKIAVAQFKLLQKGAPLASFRQDAFNICGKLMHEMVTDDWLGLMNSYGLQIRKTINK